MRWACKRRIHDIVIGIALEEGHFTDYTISGMIVAFSVGWISVCLNIIFFASLNT
jgi:hypothetical protein